MRMIGHLYAPLKRLAVNAVLPLFWPIFFAASPADGETGKTPAAIEDYVGGIAFLLEGEVCFSRLDGGDLNCLTQTDGKVRDFRFSPDLQYLAYTRVFGMVEDVGLWEDGEDVPLTESWSIQILNLAVMAVVTEIEPEGEWLHLGKWCSPDKLIYYSSSGFDVSGFYRYDARTTAVKTLDYPEGRRLLSADFSADGDQMLYVDDTGLGENFRYRLHIVELGTEDDRVIATRKMILIQSLSHDLESAAFVEVQSDVEGTEAIVWIHNMRGDSSEELITLPAKTKGSSSISWSIDDSCLGLFYSPGYRPNGYIIPLREPSDVHEISGRQFCWAGADAILYSRGASDIFLYDLKKREEKLLIKNATHPAYLKSVY